MNDDLETQCEKLIRSLWQELNQSPENDWYFKTISGKVADFVRAQRQPLVTALGKINVIRESIVGYQNVGISEHVYPLVAVLEEAGFKGNGYEWCKKKVEKQIAARNAELFTARLEEIDVITAQWVPLVEQAKTLREATDGIIEILRQRTRALDAAKEQG